MPTDSPCSLVRASSVFKTAPDGIGQCHPKARCAASGLRWRAVPSLPLKRWAARPCPASAAHPCAETESGPDQQRAGLPATVHITCATWRAGVALHLVHPGGHAAEAFKPGVQGSARFCPHAEAGQPVPTLYGGSSFNG